MNFEIGELWRLEVSGGRGGGEVEVTEWLVLIQADNNDNLLLVITLYTAHTHRDGVLVIFILQLHFYKDKENTV